MSGERIAAVDCGTNTVKLLVGEVGGAGDLRVLARETRMVRLGQGVDRTGLLDEAALVRAFTALDEYAALVREHRVDRVRFCATSATRDAGNAAVFAAGVRERLGVDPEVLDGDAEARLSFAGALRHLGSPVEAPVLVVDIGGGSTELVLGRPGGGAAGGTVDRAVSIDVGGVRLTERLLHDDPPTAEQVEACVRAVDAALDGVAHLVDPAAAATVVGVAGTVTTVAAGVLDLPAYDRERIDQAVLAVDDVVAFVDRLVAMTVAERRALPYVHPGRADVLAAGGLVLARVLRRAGARRLVVSESDILEGIAWSLVDGA